MENQTASSLATNPLVIINGGVEVTVRHLDGQTETIKVRQMPLRHMAKYGQAQGDEGRIIEVVTGQPAEWVDGLCVESQEELVTMGYELNRDPFLRWSERMLASNAHLQPLEKFVRASAKSALPSAPGATTRPGNSAA